MRRYVDNTFDLGLAMICSLNEIRSVEIRWIVRTLSLHLRTGILPALHMCLHVASHREQLSVCAYM